MSQPDSDHDLLIRIDSRLGEVHREMTEPAGRVPKLQAAFDEHEEADNKRFGEINNKLSYSKGYWTALYIVAGGLFTLIAGLAYAFAEHVMGGK